MQSFYRAFIMYRRTARVQKRKLYFVNLSLLAYMDVIEVAL